METECYRTVDIGKLSILQVYQNMSNNKGCVFSL